MNSAKDIFFREFLLDKPFSEGDVALAVSDAFKLGRQYERQLQAKATLKAIDLAKTREAREIEEERLHALGVEGYWD